LDKELCNARKNDKCSVEYENAILAMVINRLCEPESKLGVWDRWIRDRVYLPECEDIKLHQFYEAMDLLHRHQDKVEENVFFKTTNLFNLQVDLIFYDTTTISFNIDEADKNGMRQYGHAKEGGWAPQVVIALAVTREGFPVRSWIFPGNKADVTTVEQIKADLRGWELNRCLFVADSGMNSEENREEFARACGKYLLACRLDSVKEIKDEVLTRKGRYQKVTENLRVKEIKVGVGVKQRRYFLCYNPKEAERQRKHRTQVITELKQELSSHKDRKATAKWAINLLASGRYGRYLKVDKKDRIQIDTQKVNQVKKLDGKWVLITNDDTINSKDASEAYKRLLVIERCFRSLKRTQIKMGPMYHWLPRRIEAHVKICVLALLLQRIAEYELNEPWFQIKNNLRKLQAVEYEGKTHRFIRRNEIDTKIENMLNKLKISKPKQILAVHTIGEKT
jgi:transposase